MQYTNHYNLNLPEGTDIVNPLIQDNPNYSAIDLALYNNKLRVIGTATEITTGTVHALTRADQDIPAFRFVATSDFNAGDTFTVDGTPVTATAVNGQVFPDKAYVINSTVVCVLDGTKLNVLNISTAPANYPANKVYLNGDTGKDLQTALEYAATEHVVGKWIDGSDLYEKTVSCGALPNSTGKTVPHSIANLKNIVEIRGYAIRTVGSTLTYPLPFVNSDNTSRVELTVSATNISITTNVDFSYLDDTYVTLRYTKN